MTSHIDFRTMPANVPVLCIPRVYPNISKSRISRIFDDLNMGTLERIDFVSKASEKGEKFNRVFVHFRRWNDTENANIARERLLNGKEIKIIYDDPWFWKISAYREAERKPSVYREAERKPSAPSKSKPTLQFDSDEDRASNAKPVNSSYRCRDDSRERRRPDSRERRRPDERRRHDSRERRRPDERRRDDSRERRRPDQLRRPDQGDNKPAEIPKVQPRSPSSSPPRERVVDNEDLHVHEGLKVDYGNITMPSRKKRNYTTPGIAKKVLKVEDDNEEGEVVENA